MVPDVVALDQEGVDLAADELDGRRAPCGRRALDASSMASSRAAASVEVVLTSRRLGSAPTRGQDDSKEPPPRVAHQQRRSAGAVTTATSVRPATSSAIWTRQFGSRRLNDDVPSIGSMIQTRSDSPRRPNSSPRSASCGRAADSVWRTNCSTARSASVTGVPSAFDVAETPASK
ncbi:hypothetical protein F4553_000506 [Allocatelliglobosispora scoriae]|uniref:Uncharacterized protein n=1 Tax=Allocatelliglobosispora scoriae TaxID=643052 RepID=A0A841BDE6_9ACTN|nr:hypothetical protein [Allocatelliglobosispora scoriae]MBB5867127.1 hypothetical protein [Allocatelliglobosispora scoriae]